MVVQTSILLVPLGLLRSWLGGPVAVHEYLLLVRLLVDVLPALYNLVGVVRIPVRPSMGALVPNAVLPLLRRWPVLPLVLGVKPARGRSPHLETLMQKRDATVHGVHVRVTAVITPTEILVRTMAAPPPSMDKEPVAYLPFRLTVPLPLGAIHRVRVLVVLLPVVRRPLSAWDVKALEKDVVLLRVSVPVLPQLLHRLPP